MIEDVEADPRFARGVARRTGYVPRGLMAAPLLRGEAAIGVLSVLDRPRDARFTVAEMDLLALFATQAALALDLLRRARRAGEVLAGAEPGPLGELALALETIEDDDRRAAALDLVDGARSGASRRARAALDPFPLGGRRRAAVSPAARPVTSAV